MQILVVSDSHGYYPCLRDAFLMHLDADLIIHCGDGTQDVDELRKEFPSAAGRIYNVRGNCDCDTDVPRQITLDLPHGHRLTAIHGHEHMAGDFVKNFVRLAHATKSDIILFGHMHIRVDRWEDGIKIFNPGSVVKPHDMCGPSYGLIDILSSGILTSHGKLRNYSGVPEWR